MDVFCKIIDGEIPSHCFYQDDIVMCIMDANPDAPGHLLIIPKTHYENVIDIDDEVLTHINKIAKMTIKKMEENYLGITGVRVLINYGLPQVVKHFHMHLIPTYISNPNVTQEELCKKLK